MANGFYTKDWGGGGGLGLMTTYPPIGMTVK